MSEILTINTVDNIMRSTGAPKPGSSDPWDHLPPDQWVEKQVEWGKKNISGSGLVEHINKLKGDLIGVEIGVCLGVTTELYAKEIPNLKKLYAVDHYPSFIDWNGTVVSEDRQEAMKQHAANRLQPYKDKIEFVYTSSVEFVQTLEDESLDFIFIDGDHSYEGALRDFKNFYPKVKRGGIFAGHDLYIPTVEKALMEFFGNMDIESVSQNAWFKIKA